MNGELVDALIVEQKKHDVQQTPSTKQKQIKQAPQPKQAQQAGAPGSGYVWHRGNAFNNLTKVSAGQSATGIAKRDAWLAEVSRIYRNGNITWRAAMLQAARERKATNNSYLSVKDRTIRSYKGRNAATVQCSGPVCPGRYNKAPSASFRPHGHSSRRVLTQASAVKLLQAYYRSRGNISGRLDKAQLALKRDITRARNRTLTPCPVRTITDSRGRQRNISEVNQACADSWLYRRTGKFDMSGVDHNNKSTSPIYKQPLSKQRAIRQ